MISHIIFFVLIKTVKIPPKKFLAGLRKLFLLEIRRYSFRCSNETLTLFFSVHRLMWMYYFYLSLQYSCFKCDFLYISAGVAALLRTYKKAIIIFLSAIFAASSKLLLMQAGLFAFHSVSTKKVVAFRWLANRKGNAIKAYDRIDSLWKKNKIQAWVLCIWTQSAQQPDVDIFHNLPNVLACDKQIKPHMYI